MTNGEQIRSMTDEELAKFLPSGDCFCCPVLTDSSYPKYRSCEECALKWLQSNSEDKESLKNNTLTPVEFEEYMRIIIDKYKDDEELCHEYMDELIINLLRSLGYNAGCDIFDHAPKWYS